MLQRFDHRGGHLSLLCLVWAIVCLPNLGAPSLWDVDEGNNSEAAYEMRESGMFIVPTFDYEMRVDKPALLYWLQVAAYSQFGVNEFSARLPSALAALCAIFLTYELGRRTFGSAAGLISGLILTSAALFCASARFANPDALLDAFTLLTLFVFWRGYRANGPLPFASAGAISGLGMLAKGPVGLVLPCAVSILFLAWQRQLWRLFDRRLIWGVLTFILVAAPWYTWVGIETKGEWLAGFFWKHNVGRALSVMENHRGLFFYYAIVILVGFAPWSVFFAPATWNALTDARAAAGGRERDAVRFLVCWILVYVAFFTLVQTKLPNYILPIYPAVALLTGRAIDRWRAGLAPLPAWMMPVSLTCLGLVGIGVSAGLLIAAGILPPSVPTHRQLPALGTLAVIGTLPVLAAISGALFLRRDSRNAALGAIVCGCVLFTAALATFGPVAVDRYKAPKALSAALPGDEVSRDVRIGAYEYFQPSLVFYCHREVTRISKEADARLFLQGPLPAYLFLPADVWESFRTGSPAREVARHHDLYDGCDIVLITNE
jgi:4-amino-4-deoxy-L-arabinose transferase-like glycosyltransferase